MIERPEPGRYVHYKHGDEYTVIDVVRHSETEEWLVLYRAEYGDYGLWVRPIMIAMHGLGLTCHMLQAVVQVQGIVGPLHVLNRIVLA